MSDVSRSPCPNRFAWDDGAVRYAIVDMHDVDGEPLLASPEPSDNVLAILGRLKDSGSAIRSILENVSRLPRDDAKEYYQALLILSGLRGLAKAVQEEARTVLSIDLSENEVLGPAYLRGREEGQHDGRLAVLYRLVERRFGTLPEWAEKRLSGLDVFALDELAVRLLEVETLEELFSPKQ